MGKEMKRKVSWDDQDEINRLLYRILADLVYNASNYSEELSKKMSVLACTIKPAPRRKGK